MPASTIKISTLQIQRSQRVQALVSDSTEFIQQLIQRCSLALLHLSQAIKGIKWTRFAVFQNDSRSRNPIGAVGEDQVSDDVKGAPGIRAFIVVDPYVRQAT